MNKFLLGLVLGTLLGFLFAQSVSDKSDDSPAPTVHTASADAADRPKLISEPAARRSGEQPPSLQGATPIETSLPSPATATRPESEGVAAAQPTRVAPSPGSGQRTSIALPDGIKSFLDKTDTHDGLTLGQTHAKLEEEPEDLAWSYQMEIYLQQSFARPTKSGQPLEVKVIECRSTLCEIAGVSPLENPTDDISAAVQFMSQQPWWEFDNFNSTAAGDGTGGKFLLFLRRKR